MRCAIRKWVLTCFYLLCFFSAVPAWGQVVVYVLAYPYPPFINEDRQSGLTIDLVNYFNQVQSDYYFELGVVDPHKRYDALIKGRYDLILFETQEWDWQDKSNEVAFSRTLLKDGEVYITRRSPYKKQAFFKKVANESLAIYNAHHSAFAGEHVNQEWLKQYFKVSVLASYREILDWVLKEKTDIGVLPLSFLRIYFKEHPDEIEHYLISQDFAHVYKLQAAVSHDSPMTLGAFEKMLAALKVQDGFREILEKNGVLRLWEF